MCVCVVMKKYNRARDDWIKCNCISMLLLKIGFAKLCYSISNNLFNYPLKLEHVEFLMNS